MTDTIEYMLIEIHEPTTDLKLLSSQMIYNQIIYLFITPMTTLDPALDKLRNKEVSFGCVVKSRGTEYIFLTRQDESYHTVATLDFRMFTVRGDKLDDEIIWHPLTRGRLCHLGYPKLWNNKVHSREDTRCEEMWKLLINIEDLLLDMQSFDKTEIERMTSPKRPELRELLVKFAEYI